MANRIGAVHLRTQKGELMVYGLSQTPRGQNFIRKVVDLDAKKMSDPDFKAKLAVAVEKTLA